MTHTQTEEVLFYHAACFIPTKSAFIQAIKNGAFTSWPSLTVKLAQKYLPKTEATFKGHLKQQYKGTRTPQQKPAATNDEPVERITDQTHQVFLKVTDLTKQSTPTKPAVSQ